MPVLSIPPSERCPLAQAGQHRVRRESFLTARDDHIVRPVLDERFMPRTDSRSDRRNSSVNGLTPKYRIYSSTVRPWLFAHVRFIAGEVGGSACKNQHHIRSRQTAVSSTRSTARAAEPLRPPIARRLSLRPCRCGKAANHPARSPAAYRKRARRLTSSQTHCRIPSSHARSSDHILITRSAFLAYHVGIAAAEAALLLPRRGGIPA